MEGHQCVSEVSTCGGQRHKDFKCLPIDEQPFSHCASLNNVLLLSASSLTSLKLADRLCFRNDLLSDSTRTIDDHDVGQISIHILRWRLRLKPKAINLNIFHCSRVPLPSSPVGVKAHGLFTEVSPAILYEDEKRSSVDSRQGSEIVSINRKSPRPSDRGLH